MDDFEGMQDFALIAEGTSDKPIISNVLAGYFKTAVREPLINPFHPNPQDTAPTGGWSRLFTFLRDKRFRRALQFNRFIVVHVDSDAADDYGVVTHDKDGPLSVDSIVEAVKNRLIVEIGPEDWSTYATRFIFAVAVRNIECWILPLWEDRDAYAGRVENCSKALSRALRKKNLVWREKDASSYAVYSRGYLKKATLTENGPKSPSLKLFLEDLNRRNITLPLDDE
ncbi:MAG TPA: hypothetical protein VKX17_15195 [Planctomycetota bacterium]|nr:hypothetical protein [Planctomycetota bacterium]